LGLIYFFSCVNKLNVTGLVKLNYNSLALAILYGVVAAVVGSILILCSKRVAGASNAKRRPSLTESPSWKGGNY
jgi:hypothetical protein